MTEQRKLKIRIWDEDDKKPVFKSKGNKEHVFKELEGFFKFK